MTPEQIIEKFNATEKMRKEYVEQVRAAGVELDNLRSAYWQLTGKIQIGDTLSDGKEKGVVFEIEFSDWQQPPKLTPRIIIKLYKKDGTLGERTKTVWSPEYWTITKKAA
jgi:hypothetical protein